MCVSVCDLATNELTLLNKSLTFVPHRINYKHLHSDVFTISKKTNYIWSFIIKKIRRKIIAFTKILNESLKVISHGGPKNYIPKSENCSRGLENVLYRQIIANLSKCEH